MAAIELKIFDNDKDDEVGDTLEIEIDGEFVVVNMTLWIEGLGSFELARLKIHHPVAKKICEAGLRIRQQARAEKK